MFRSKKLALICVLMIAAGLMLSAVGYLLGGRVWGIGLNQSGIWVNSPNITGGEGYHYVKETKELEAFTGIDADVDFGDLIIEPSDHYGISYNVPEDCRFDVTVEEGVLKVIKRNREVLGIQNNFVAMGRGIAENRRENAYVKISIPAGLEFDTVHIIDANEGITPYKKAVLPADMEEERRMFYVALTRAKQELHLYASKKIHNHEAEVSRFLIEGREYLPGMDVCC